MGLRKVSVVIAVAAVLSFPGQASMAQTPPAPAAPAPPAPAAADPFGEEVMLTAKTMVFFKGTATWDSAFETLTGAFKAVSEFLQKQGVKAAGPAMTVYLATDDTGFQFQAGYPVAEEPKEKPQGDITLAKSPEGKALKFVHRGSYDAMEFDLRRRHQLSRGKTAGIPRPADRAVRDRSAGDRRGQAGHRGPGADQVRLAHPTGRVGKIAARRGDRH